jgi:hypothetical protein
MLGFKKEMVCNVERIQSDTPHVGNEGEGNWRKNRRKAAGKPRSTRAIERNVLRR